MKTTDTYPSMAVLQALAARYASGYAAVLDAIAACADQRGDPDCYAYATCAAGEMRNRAAAHAIEADAGEGC